jgi:hypothetical protein
MEPILHYAGSRPTTGPGVHLGVLEARLAGTSADPVRPKPAANGPMVTYDLTNSKGKTDHSAEDALYNRPGDPDANPFMAPSLEDAPAQAPTGR